ncbi:MAG: pseudouridine synthase [Lachnospiraceae bacterium]|nr:pseudouridine synthase [Lachnospiraceae bacterium]
MQQKSIRLDKYLADAGLGSRRECRAMIMRGLVSVDNRLIRDAGYKVLSSQAVTYEGDAVISWQEKYILLHKPSGYISATEADAYHPCVLELVPAELRKNLFPVGRLDQDTTGLLLLTTDGKWAHRLTSPKKDVEKTYYFRLDVSFPTDKKEAFENGVDIGDELPTKPCRLQMDSETEGSITITEGRYHQVKRMFAAYGCTIIALHRLRVGGFRLKDLKEGEYRFLTQDEISSFSTLS